MAKVEIGKWEIEEEELDRQHVQAKRRGNQQRKTEAQAQSVQDNRQINELVVKLKSGITFLLPVPLLQDLAEATPEEIAQVQLGPRGASLYWENLDVHFGLTELIGGTFGTRMWMAQLGQTKDQTNPGPTNGKQRYQSAKPILEK